MKIKRLIAGMLTVCGLFSIGAAVARFPPFGVVYDVTYYSDASYTTRIGNERWTCTGYLHWGQTSVYRVENTWPCNEE
jgi:Family of unknown function (DUF6289)